MSSSKGDRGRGSYWNAHTLQSSAMELPGTAVQTQPGWLLPPLLPAVSSSQLLPALGRVIILLFVHPFIEFYRVPSYLLFQLILTIWEEGITAPALG